MPNNNRLWLKVYLDPTLDTAPGNALRDEDVIEKGDPGLKVDSVYQRLARRGVDGTRSLRHVRHHLPRPPRPAPNSDVERFGSYPLRKDYPLRGVGERENYKIVTREGA